VKYRLVLTLAAVPLAGMVLAQAPPSSAEHVDLLFLRGPRPVLLRLHVRVDGLPHHSPWSNYLHELFTVLDRDRDGVLNVAEAGRAPKGQTLAQQARGGGFFGQQGALATFQEMAADPDSGEITFEEFAAYYYKSGFRPLVVNFGQGGNPGLMADALTDALFKFLDQDRDGKLSQEEVGRAEAALRKLDLDDDELISVQEFLPNPFGNGVFIPQQQPFNLPASQQPAFAVLDPTQPATAWVSPLVRTYDKNRNGKLDGAEVGLDQVDFERLDANRDGELDADELPGLPALRPGAEFVLRLGKLGENEAAADLLPAEGRPAPLAQQIAKSSSGLTLTVGAAQINLPRPAPAQPGNLQGQQVRSTLQFYLQQFRNADPGKKGYLERKDLQQNRQLQFLVNIFPLADADEDDRLTEKEVTDWFELQTRVATAYLTLTVGDSGRGLFDLLDQNRDSRLGTRELRTAWERIRPWTRDQAPIARTEIPGQFSLSVSLGPGGATNPSGRPFVVGTSSGFNPAVPPAARSGPVWFHKMDRNGDGDLSRREFLGSKEDFARIDANGDGLISLEEATKFDAQSRK
jgi:hypothetical protein